MGEPQGPNQQMFLWQILGFLYLGGSHKGQAVDVSMKNKVLLYIDGSHEGQANKHFYDK